MRVGQSAHPRHDLAGEELHGAQDVVLALAHLEQEDQVGRAQGPPEALDLPETRLRVPENELSS